jgi:hypothetical protein
MGCRWLDLIHYYKLLVLEFVFLSITSTIARLKVIICLPVLSLLVIISGSFYCQRLLLIKQELVKLLNKSW